MPDSPAVLVSSSLLEVFGQRDEAARREAAERVFAPDVVFRDTESEVDGVDALLDKVAGLLGGAPGDWVFAAAGPAREIADLATVNWTFGPAAGPAVVTGTDIVLVEDGRIAKLYTFTGGA